MKTLFYFSTFLLCSAKLQAQIYGVGNGGGFAFAIKGGSGSEVSLPIELLFFDGQCTENEVKLEWKTASEQNNEFFTVERSDSLTSWQIIGTKDGSSNSNEILSYDLTDPNPLVNAYYRLKQTDKNGDFEYCKPIFVSCKQEKALEPLIFPNPSSDFINITSDEEIRSIKIYDIKGSLIKSDKTSKVDVSAFPKGNYIISIETKSGIETKKFIKN